jgi:hypothetical protein
VITAGQDSIQIDAKKVRVFAEKDPAKLDALVANVLLPNFSQKAMLGYHPMMIRDDAWPLIQGAELTLLAKRAARMVKSYRHAGADTNFVRVALVAEVIRVIEVRVAVGADKLGWDEKNDRVTGLLAYIVWELLPWLPGWPCTPRGLYEALLAARTVVGRLKLRRRESPL